MNSVNYLRPVFIKVGFAVFVLTLGVHLFINVELTPRLAFDWIESRVSLIDKLARNDFVVEVTPLATDSQKTVQQTAFQPDSPAEDQLFLGSAVLSEQNSADSLPDQTGIVAGDSIIVVNAPQVPSSGFTTSNIDRLVMQNIQNVVDAGWLKQSVYQVDNSRTVINQTSGIGNEVSGATEGSILFTGFD
jgi:hypothetical protein